MNTIMFLTNKSYKLKSSQTLLRSKQTGNRLTEERMLMTVAVSLAARDLNLISMYYKERGRLTN